MPFVSRGAALGVASLLMLTACASSKAASTASTSATSTSSPAATTSSSMASSAASSSSSTTASSPATSAATPTSAAAAAGTAKVDANNAAQADVAAALRAAGVSNPENWAREVVEYRPYPTNDPSFAKLKQNLAKYNPSPAVVDGIISVLKL